MRFDLAKKERLYLVVDGAQVDELARALYRLEGQIELEPIYMQPPHNELLSVSPYVIEATKYVKEWFFKLNKPLAGYFISSVSPLAEICENFRNIITAESPYGSRIYIKMANAECAWVFYSTQSPQFWVHTAKVWIATRRGWQYLESPFSELPPYEKELKVSDEQWRLLGDISWDNTIEKLENHMMKWFSHEFELHKNSESWIRYHADSAYSQGFTTERDLLMYINIIGFLGEENFLDTAQHPDIHELLEQPSLQTPSQRVEAAANLAYQYSQQQYDQEKQV